MKLQTKKQVFMGRLRRRYSAAKARDVVMRKWKQNRRETNGTTS